ncbi:MAG: aldo/keto reductase, partial [Gemmatimonadaceae bacterium]
MTNSLDTLSPVVAGVWRMAAWNWTPQERLRWIEACLDLGVTSFDHADLYGGYTVEALFGEALALAPGLRQQMQLVTKCGIQLRVPARPGTRIKHYDTSAAHITASVERSLRALRTDAIELLLLHRPDPLMDADEVA